MFRGRVETRLKRCHHLTYSFLFRNIYMIYTTVSILNFQYDFRFCDRNLDITYTGVLSASQLINDSVRNTSIANFKTFVSF